MELEEALREIERLRAENESLRAELYAERAEKEKALLALLHEREKRKIAYARQFLPRTEKSSCSSQQKVDSKRMTSFIVVVHSFLSSASFSAFGVSALFRALPGNFSRNCFGVR